MVVFLGHSFSLQTIYNLVHPRHLESAISFGPFLSYLPAHAAIKCFRRSSWLIGLNYWFSCTVGCICYDSLEPNAARLCC